MREKTDIKDVVERMKACAQAWKEAKEQKTQTECPPGQVWDEKLGKCVPIEGKEQYPLPEEGSSREWTDFKPGERLEVPAGPAEDAKELAKKETLSESNKKETTETTETVVVEMSEKPCESCPEKTTEKKEEAPKEEAPKEEVKTTEVKQEETKQEQTVAETVKTEVKEEPKEVETKPAQEQPAEVQKQPSEEEVIKYVKEHWAELLVELSKKKKF